jgi:hypothetical protein
VAGAALPSIRDRGRIARRSGELTLSVDLAGPPPRKERFRAPALPRFPEPQREAPAAAPEPRVFSDDFGLEQALRELAPPPISGTALAAVELPLPPPPGDLQSTRLWAVHTKFVASLQRPH